MIELTIKQERPYAYTDGRESTIRETILLYFKNMEEVTTTINLMMLGSDCEISFSIREIEEGQIYEK